jgi:aminoglycoside/choline kinase family phosphotransferase
VIPAPTRTALAAEWRVLAEELAAEPRVLCHRDYHSRNLMLHRGELYIIDFQDARLGPDTYDLVSLVRDSYVDLTESAADELIAYFIALKRPSGTPQAEFLTWGVVSNAVRRDGATAEPESARDVRLQASVRRSRLHQYIPRTIRHVQKNLSPQAVRAPARALGG